MSRTPLPNRRRSIIRDVRWRDQLFQVGVGYDDADQAREVFCDGPKEGTDMRFLLADACVLISLALQHGVTRDGLAHSLSTTPAFENGEAIDARGSLIGELVAALVPIEEAVG